jgi:hypothetical protein
MKRTASLTLVFAVVPLLLSGQRLEYLGGGAGVLAPTGTFGDVEHMGWHVAAAALGTIKGSLGFTLDALYAQMTHQHGVSGRTSLGGGTVNLAILPGRARGPIRPFVMAGAGLFRVNIGVPGFGSAADIRLAFSGGGGVVLGSGRRRGFLAARFVTVRTADATSFVPVSAGIMFPLGSR